MEKCSSVEKMYGYNNNGSHKTLKIVCEKKQNNAFQRKINE